MTCRICLSFTFSLQHSPFCLEKTDAKQRGNGCSRTPEVAAHLSVLQRFYPSHLELHAPSLVPAAPRAPVGGAETDTQGRASYSQTLKTKPQLLFCWKDQFVAGDSCCPSFQQLPWEVTQPALLPVGLHGIHFLGDATAIVSRNSDDSSTQELRPGLYPGA